MSKTLNKWTRKIHRWFVIPFAVVFILMILTQNTPTGQSVQQIMRIMLIGLLPTGIYLFLLPYWSKWQRNRRQMNRK